MGRKIILSHREVEVKIFLEVLAVFAILIIALAGISKLEPGITGFAVMPIDYSGKAGTGTNFSGEIIKTMLSLTSIAIAFLLMLNLVFT